METLDRNKLNAIWPYISFLFLFFHGLIISDISHAACNSIEWGSSNNWVTADKDNNNKTVGVSYTTGTDSTLTINAYGTDVWTSEDEYYAYYRDDLSGDWSVQVKVISQTTTDKYKSGSHWYNCTLDEWAKSGIMVKNDLSVSGEDSVSDSSRKYGYCMVAMTPLHGVTFQWDSDSSNGYLDSGEEEAVSSLPVWLKLEKSGTAFSAYYSTDGVNWTQVGSSVTLSTANTVQDLGLFVTAHKDSFTEGNNVTQFRDFCLETTATYTIEATAGANGTITSGSTTIAAGATADITVVEGYSQTFTIDPDTGYEIGTVKVDGTPQTLTGNSYTFENVTSDHTISAAFVKQSYTIIASAGSGGSISPSGGVSVEYNDNQAFTISPGTGYQLSQVLVDGVDVTDDVSEDTYTFISVTSNHTIAVTFCPASYTITAITGSGGSISPGTDVTLAYGESQTYTITPDEGYYATVTVDGTTVISNSADECTYTFTSVSSDHTIRASFNTVAGVSDEIAGCDTSVTSDYTSGFTSSDFALDNLNIVDGKIVLETGSSAIDPENIVIPFEQEVAVTFLYEGAGYISDFGYMLYSDAVDSSGNFLGWSGIDISKKHVIYHNINDDYEGEGGDGILDTDYGNGSFPKTSETAIAAYNDGSGIPFVPDGDGTVTGKDMRKVLGTFEAGTELVFFLTANTDWNTAPASAVYFNKKSWNPDLYTSCTPSTGSSYTNCSGTTSTNFNKTSNSFNKKYNLGVVGSETSCSINDRGWLMEDAITRMYDLYGITLSGSYSICLQYGKLYDHVIVGAPEDDPNQWILGWEDYPNGGDVDHNDMVFRIERQTGGLATLETTAAPVLAAGSYYTAATIEVYDYMPCSGDTLISYWVSIDGGENWMEVTTWDAVYESSASKTIGDKVADWTPGTPAYTYRTYRIDFAGLGMSGDTLIWKAQLQSEDEDCAPEILNVSISGTVATNGSFSRSSPVVQTNMTYSGSYETPAITWADKTVLRGHLKATRIYDPADPTKTAAVERWDAGAVLASRDASTRTIYFPNIAITKVTEEFLATGDEETFTFTGTLAHFPIEAESLSITDTVEKFTDVHTDELEGTKGGTGTINRFTGEYTVTFNTAPSSGVPVKASYSYYTTSSSLKVFNAANVTSTMLGLDDTYVIGDGFTYDLDNDGAFNNVTYGGSETPDDSDGDYLVNWVRGFSDGASSQKEWILGPVDHSTPAIETPPGTPSWYYGTDITEEEREKYNAFRNSTAMATRRTIAYVGARDGMIHAFDAGALRWGDNSETTDITENRGYFEWKTANDSSSADYGDGSELWAFIPANLMSRLKNNLLQAEDQAYVDASPTLADVYINDQWRTVLVCAEGNGGDSVFALDVTDPYTPTFMWEFADPDLFRSRSSPTVGLGRIFVGGEAKWVAIFVSGKSSDSSTYPSLYIVSVEDGTLIKRVYLDAVADGKGGIPSGQPAMADSDGNGYIDRLYIGTDKGYLYKVNLPDDPKSSFTTITNCIINKDFTDEDGNSVDSSQRYHPIYAAPSISVDNSVGSDGETEYNILVFFGTGDSPYYDEDINTSDTTYHFFVYVDNEDKGECGTSAYLDWFLELDDGERVWASAYSAAGQIYFGTSTAETEDPCEATATGANEGKLYVYTTSGEKVASFETGNIITAPVVEDEHVYFRTSDGLSSLGGSTYNNKTKLTGTGTSRIISWEEISD